MTELEEVEGHQVKRVTRVTLFDNKFLELVVVLLQNVDYLTHMKMKVITNIHIKIHTRTHTDG